MGMSQDDERRARDAFTKFRGRDEEVVELSDSADNSSDYDGSSDSSASSSRRYRKKRHRGKSISQRRRRKKSRSRSKRRGGGKRDRRGSSRRSRKYYSSSPTSTFGGSSDDSAPPQRKKKGTKAKRSSEYNRESVLPSDWTPSSNVHGDIAAEGDADGADRSIIQSAEVVICARLSQQSIGADE